MPKTRPPYAPEFRRQMVDLVRAGRDPADLAREFEPSAQAIRNWVAQAGAAEVRQEGKESLSQLAPAEREELAAFLVLSCSMAWSPPACQRRIGSLQRAGDYAATRFHHLRDGTLAFG